MARRANDFQTIRSEGGLLPPDLLRRVLDPKEKIPGTSSEDYGLPQGERVNETITQSWNRLRRHWTEFSQAAQRLPEGEPGTGLTNDRWNLPLLRELGFGLLPTSAGPEIGGRTYAINRFFGPVAIHLVGCGLSLDRRTAGVRGAASTNPHGLVQEFLNRAQGYLWGIVSNGFRFRILRDNQALSRQSYLEFDLEAMFTGEVFSDFVLLWLMAHATRFTVGDGGRPETCWLEQWTKLAEEQGTRALESLKGGVEKALEVLGQGFVSHPRNTALRESLRSGALVLTDFHSQLLRVVYRLIFLFVAEDRTLEGIPLLHPRDESEKGRQARERHFAHYSTSRLRELASRIKGSRHGDLWHQFNVIVGTISGDERFAAARENLSLPILGSFLWSPGSTSALNAPSLIGGEGIELANMDFLEAIRYLAFTSQGKVLRPVDYRNLGSEELGGVYESLLALTPQISGDGARFTFAEFAGNERKTSGSYYTPDSLVQCLLDSALDPVVEGAIKGKSGNEAEKAILSLKVCDPAVGSGHFLVGAAHRLARHLARIRAVSQGESEPSPPVYQHALRDIISHCLYGVDINPMAAELCRVSLWLEALEPGKPLSFLDHHIRVGNSLLGTAPELIVKGIPDDAFKPIEGDDKKACAELKKRNKRERQGLGPLFAEHDAEIQAQLAKAAAELEELPDDRPEDVQFKELFFRDREETKEYRRKKLLADVWCAAFAIRKYLRESGRDSSAFGLTQRNLNDLAGGQTLPTVFQDETESLAKQYQFFHWHLAFPEVFAKGGFDCVLGNPPWERVKLQEREWFAERYPEVVSAKSAAVRKKMIEEIKAKDKVLYAQYLNALRAAEGESHLIRHSQLFPLSSYGDINTYGLFIELSANMTNPRGTVGIVVPTGIATDDSQKIFFQNLMQNRRLVSLYGFENQQRLFRDLPLPQTFCLLTLAGKGKGPVATIFSFFAYHPSQLAEEGRCFKLSYADLALIKPNSLTCPSFRSSSETGEVAAWSALITKSIYSQMSVLIKESEPCINPWDISFHTLFHMTNDAELFHTKEDLEAEDYKLLGNSFIKDDDLYLPLYESKMLHHFNHRYNTFAGLGESSRFNVKAAALGSSDEELLDPHFLPLPRFWVNKAEILSRWPSRDREWIIAFRDITNVSTNRRTAIFCLVPKAAYGNNAPLLSSSKSALDMSALYAQMTSFAFDFITRQVLSGTHLNFFILKQIPVFLPQFYYQSFFSKAKNLREWLLQYVLELTYTAWDLEPFSLDCGYNGPPFRWDEQRRFLIRCELDAAFFHLYLGSDEGWRKESESLTNAFPTRRHAVEYIMETFPILKRKDEAAYGNYRTKDTILEIYDALTEAIRTGQPYQTRLNPPPGPPANNQGNFLPLPEWLPGEPKPPTWPPHIHPPRGCEK